MGTKSTRKSKKILTEVLHNAIPYMCVLANRHISTSGQCPICETHAEDVEHMLIKCSRANQIWRHLGLHETIDSPHDPTRSGAEVLEMILCDPLHQRSYMGVVDLPEMVAISCW